MELVLHLLMCFSFLSIALGQAGVKVRLNQRGIDFGKWLYNVVLFWHAYCITTGRLVDNPTGNSRNFWWTAGSLR